MVGFGTTDPRAYGWNDEDGVEITPVTSVMHLYKRPDEFMWVVQVKHGVVLGAASYAVFFGILYATLS